MFIPVLIWIALVVVAGIIASNKGRFAIGWAIAALFLSPLIIIILVVLPAVAPPKPPVTSAQQNTDDTATADTKKCPFCAEQILADAVLCRYCNQELTYDDEQDPYNDAWGGGFCDASDPKAVTATLKLNYKDGSGNKSQRVVDVREIDKNLYGGVLIGYCHVRDANRTFRFDRIESCVDVETGEAVSDVRTYLQNKYDNSPEASLDKLLISHLDLLRVLLFVGKADGRLMANERAIIMEHAKQLSNDDRLDDAVFKKTLASLNVPSITAYKQCCGRLIKKISPEQYQDLINTPQRIVDTQKTVTPSEQEALDYMRKRLAKMATI